MSPNLNWRYRVETLSGEVVLHRMTAHEAFESASRMIRDEEHPFAYVVVRISDGEVMGHRWAP